MAQKTTSYNKAFQTLTSQVNGAIISNDGLIGDQKDQVELLFSLEQKFKHNIQKYQQSTDIYKKFIHFIVKENGNILSARPYFREKADVFNSQIAGAIKDGDTALLMKFDINFQLINFIVKNWKGKVPDRPNRYYLDFLNARRILIENNLPLAINRAKLFYRKTPRSHLSLLDLIDICTHGLISGVDKFVGSYSKVWRSVCIGRMVGYMIEEYSKTFLRMYPVDKKILYRANSLRFKLKIEAITVLTVAVNESFERDKLEGKKTPKLPITEVHIRTLLNGSSYISADQQKNDEDGTSIYDFTADKAENSEITLVKKDLFEKISVAAKDLTVVEKKIIRLKGVVL